MIDDLLTTARKKQNLEVEIDHVPSGLGGNYSKMESDRPLGLDIPGGDGSPNTKAFMSAVPEERIKLFFDTRKKDIDNRSQLKAGRFFPALREATRVYHSKVRQHQGSVDIRNHDVDSALTGSFD